MDWAFGIGLLTEQGKPADFLGIWIGITPGCPGQLFAIPGAVLR